MRVTRWSAETRGSRGEYSKYDGEHFGTEHYDCCDACWREKIAPLFKTGPTKS